MKFRPRTKIILLILLVALNIALRVPSIAHESGWDSFSTHILANSISNFGNARWWANSLSIFGYYPDSYPSAIPFILSGLSQINNMEMEHTIWLFSLFIGILSIFTSYLFAGVIKDDDFFKFLVAFGFSTSQGVLTFTTWNISTRGAFIILLPLFLYFLIKIKISLKNLLLFFILLVLLTAIHHLVIATSILIFSAIILSLIHIFSSIVNFRLNIKYVSILIFMSYIILFFYSFNSKIFIEDTAYSSKYGLMMEMIQTYVRYIGPLLIFFIGGLVYQIFKNYKTIEEILILLCFFVSIPFIFYPKYGIWFLIIFFILFIAQGILNLNEGKNRNFVNNIIFLILVISVGFSGYYQHYRTSNEIPSSFDRFLTEKSFSSAIWIKNNINGNMFGNDVESNRIFAISQVPTLVGLGDIDFTYGFENVNDLNISKVSPLSLDYYAEGPYIRAAHTPYTSFFLSVLNGDTYDGRWGKELIPKYNLSYFIEHKLTYTKFSSNIINKDNLYDNGKIRIWSLK